MKDDLKNFKMEDNLKNVKMEDDLKNVNMEEDLKNFKVEDDLTNFKIEDDLKIQDCSPGVFQGVFSLSGKCLRFNGSYKENLVDNLFPPA